MKTQETFDQAIEVMKSDIACVVNAVCPSCKHFEQCIPDVDCPELANRVYPYAISLAEVWGTGASSKEIALVLGL